MASFDQTSFVELLTNPRESLDVEIKSWLNLRSKHGKATLAKAALALANHGGGIIVLGLTEVNGGYISEANPFRAYDTDLINSSISQYAEPPFHCDLHSIDHPETGNRHTIVVVPDTLKVPVMTKKNSAIFEQRKVFIRKPGPKSEEISDSAEWQQIMDRLSVLRASEASDTNQKTDVQRLANFVHECRQFWQESVEDLPEDDPARFPHGSFEVAFSLVGYESSPTRRELRDMLRDGPRATRGWPPFITLSREPYTEKVIGGAIECWLGDPEGDRTFHSAYFSPFWRAHPNGYFYQIEGYFEPERVRSLATGTPLYPEFTISRLAHFLLHAHDLARRFGTDADILLACRFTGLKDKILVGTPQRPLFRNYRCHDKDFAFETRVSQVQIQDNLVGIIHQQLSQLYDLFTFFELKELFVANCLKELES